MANGSKLGLHIHSWNDPIFQYCKTVGGAVHIILEHNPTMVNEVKRAQPKSLLVARLWVDKQPLQNPIQDARDFTELLLQRINGCHYDAATGYNEWDGDLNYHDGRPEGMEIFKRYADFEAERSRILHREGLLSVVGGCSVGTPPEHWFSAFKPALEEGDFLHLHEYSAPRMWDAENWHCLKYRFAYKYLAEHGLPILPLIISECGVDGGVAGRPREGWRKFGPQGIRAKKRAYMEQWAWYDKKMMENWYVVGSAAFDCGGGGGLGWASFNMDPEMLPLYARRIKAHGVSYWEPKEEPMDVWEKVKNERPDVAKFAHEIGKATSEHHVPIPDYEGQPISPAKTMAVIIANEKNPCDPNFVNEFEEKDKEDKPTGKMLHAVGLCGVVAEHTQYTIEQLKDPQLNIKCGLAILDVKLSLMARNIREAYYLYTGGSRWASKDLWVTTVWVNRFCQTYQHFWGITLESGGDDREALLARIAELERREAECLAELEEVAKIRKDDKAAFATVRNIVNDRIDRKD